MAIFTNKDGLVIHTGPRTTSDRAVARLYETDGAFQELVVDVSFNNLGLTTATYFDQDADGNGTNDSPSVMQAAIPAGSYIQSSTFIVKTAFVGATAVLNIGTYKADGTAIDADGLDAAIAVAALTAGAVIVGDGAQVGTTIANTAPSGYTNTGIYIGMDTDTAVFSAGSARLIVRFVPPRA